jgi:hypothetical protein
VIALNYIRARYETGPVATFLFFAVCLASAFYGFVRGSHFARFDGWMDIVLATLLFLNFHKRFRRDDTEPRP